VSYKSSNIIVLLVMIIGLFPIRANEVESPTPAGSCESSVNNLKDNCVECLQKSHPEKSKCIYTSYMQMTRNYPGCFAELQSTRNQYCDFSQNKKHKCLKIRIALKNNCKQCIKKNKNKNGRELCFYHSFYRYLEKNNTCIDGLKKTFKRHCNKKVPAVKIKPSCPALISSMKIKCKRCRKQTKKKSFIKCVDNFYYHMINKNFQCYKRLKKARKKICNFK